METYDLVDALQAHQGQRHFRSYRQTSETCPIRRKPHYGIFFNALGTATLVEVAGDTLILSNDAGPLMTFIAGG